MPSSTDKIVDGFPFPSIPPILGTPDYEKIAEVHLQINSNTASVYSNLGNRSLGLLYLTVLPAVYNNLSVTTFVPPSNPGATPDIPVKSTVAKIAALRYAHTTVAVLFDNYNRTDKALCQKILSAVDKLFVCSLLHCYVGYDTVSTHDILNHLYATYVNISPSGLQ